MKNKKKIIKVVAICLGIFLVELGFLGNHMVNFAISRSSGSTTAINNSLSVAKNPEQKRLEEMSEANKKRLRAASDAWDKATPLEEKTITSTDGLKLKGFIHKQDSTSHRWCIAIHGYNCDHTFMTYIAQQYFEHGYNVLSPDLRSSGKSDGKYIGMGWLERQDILQWIDTIVKLDPQAKIALHGVSMGAATVMMVSGEQLPPNVKVCVEDCGYSSIWAQFANKLKALYHLPIFPVLNVASLVCKVKAGYFFSDGDCVAQLHKNRTPMLFIHGSADDYVPFDMLNSVYNADACADKQMLVIKGARHSMSCYTDPAKYWSSVFPFVDRHIK